MIDQKIAMSTALVFKMFLRNPWIFISTWQKKSSHTVVTDQNLNNLNLDGNRTESVLHKWSTSS